MRLEVRRLVRDQAVSEGVALVEGVVRELLDDVEEFLAELAAVSRGLDTSLERVTLRGHHLPDLLSDGLPEIVGLGE